MQHRKVISQSPTKYPDSPLVQETFTGTLAPDEEVTFDFSTPLDIASNGAYTLTATVDLSGDENPFNDTQSSFNAYVSTTVPTAPETFETTEFLPPIGLSRIQDNDITWAENKALRGLTATVLPQRT